MRRLYRVGRDVYHRCHNCGSHSAPHQRILTVEDGGEWIHLCSTCNNIYHDFDDDKAKRDELLKAERETMDRIRGVRVFQIPQKSEGGDR